MRAEGIGAFGVAALSQPSVGLPLWFSRHSNLDVSTFFEPHIISVFVR